MLALSARQVSREQLVFKASWEILEQTEIREILVRLDPLVNLDPRVIQGQLDRWEMLDLRVK